MGLPFDVFVDNCDSSVKLLLGEAGGFDFVAIDSFECEVKGGVRVDTGFDCTVIFVAEVGIVFGNCCTKHATGLSVGVFESEFIFDIFADVMEYDVICGSRVREARN